jgi:hypothetical protein
MMVGSVSISQHVFIGDFGQWYQDEYAKLLPTKKLDASTCYNYDAALLVAETASFLLNIGHEFENHSVMRDGFYKIRFTGCTGTVNFSQGTNDRDIATFRLENL